MESEMLFILVLALIVLGPRKLPEIGRHIGRALAEFRRAKNEFARQIEEEIQRADEQDKKDKSTAALGGGPAAENRIQPPANKPAGTVNSSLTGVVNDASVAESAPGSTV
jgi:sec-independent protein translocase protein TatB